MAKEVSKNKKKEVSKDKKNFGKDFKAELKKVSWPTFKQLVNNTTAVIVIVLITAAIVFVLDLAFETVNKYGVDKLKAIVTSNSSDNAEGTTDVEIDTNTVDDNAIEDSNAEETKTDENNSEVSNEVTEDATTVETSDNLGNTVEQ